VFDSGLGGLTVVRAIRKVLPQESILYLGDTARVPYGNKSARLVQTYANQIADFLLERGAKLIVVACNTASALALPSLRETFDVPVIGVIEPGVEAALKATRNNHIGVIGTIATIESGSYARSLKRRNGSVTVTSQPCPLFVPLVEEGWLEGEVPGAVARTYLADINQATVDTLILGCTHYPLLKSILEQVVKPGTVLVDSAEEVATKIATVLEQEDLATDNPEPSELTCYVTDLPARFETVARRFLGSAVPAVTTVQLS
jgi:glutamate racemase